MKRMMALLTTVAMMTLVIPALYAEDGVTAQEIKLGQSAALSGAAQALGQGMKLGLDVAFEEANAAGGVGGRKIVLISKDDGYEPEKAIANTRELLEKDKVFLLIGEVGTPTSTAVVPIAEQNKVPFWAPFTGAEFLRNPFKKYVVNVRASYFQEMEKLATMLVDKKKLSKIACLYQNDSYGQAGLKGIEQALAKRNLKLLATGTYERNTVAVKKGLLDIRKAEPEAVVMVGAYKACAEFIKLAKQAGMKDTVYCNISFVGTDALCAELGEAGEGVIISQVVTYPHDESVPLVKEYTAALKKYKPDAKPGFVSLEGYMAGKLFCKVVADVKGELTRESLLKALEEAKKYDLGGVTLTYGDQDHQGMDEVFLTVIQGGKAVSLKE